MYINSRSPMPDSTRKTDEELNALLELEAKATPGRIVVERRWGDPIYVIPEADSGKSAGAHFVSEEDHRKSYFAVIAQFRKTPRQWDGITQEQHEANISLYAQSRNSIRDIILDLQASREAQRELVEAAKSLVSALDTCHLCQTTLLVEDGPIYCEDGCSNECGDHDGPDCEPISVIHARLKQVLARAEAKEKQP